MIIGRLDRGSDLIESLMHVCAAESVRCGEIRALGALSRVELCAYDQKAQKYGPSRSYRGNLEILALHGNVSEKQGELACHLHATLARDTDNGIQVIGGHVITARIFACEFTIATCDDLILRRSMDDTTGLPLWSEKFQLPKPLDPKAAAGEAQAESGPPAPKENKEAVRAAKDSSPPHNGAAAETAGQEEVTWEDVMSATIQTPEKQRSAAQTATKAKSKAKATDEAELQAASAADAEPAAKADPAAEATPEADLEETEAEEEQWVEPQYGDIMVHPHFGRCTVERIEEGEYLHVTMSNGRTIRLNLAVINLELTGFEKGKQIFEARMGG
jgi:predicted DNA-binding protein with PD1-like motif